MLLQLAEKCFKAMFCHTGSKSANKGDPCNCTLKLLFVVYKFGFLFVWLIFLYILLVINTLSSFHREYLYIFRMSDLERAIQGYQNELDNLPDPSDLQVRHTMTCANKHDIKI